MVHLLSPISWDCGQIPKYAHLQLPQELPAPLKQQALQHRCKAPTTTQTRLAAIPSAMLPLAPWPATACPLVAAANSLLLLVIRLRRRHLNQLALLPTT
jgi:hypothetical protein